MSIKKLSSRNLVGRGTIEGLTGRVNGAGDPYWNQTSLAMHFNGTDGSTNFVDLKGHTMTTVNAVHSTSQSKFGGTSAQLSVILINNTAYNYYKFMGYPGGSFPGGYWDIQRVDMYASSDGSGSAIVPNSYATNFIANTGSPFSGFRITATGAGEYPTAYLTGVYTTATIIKSVTMTLLAGNTNRQPSPSTQVFGSTDNVNWTLIGTQTYTGGNFTMPMSTPNVPFKITGQSDFTFGTADFTIEFWCYLPTAVTGSSAVLVDFRAADGLYPCFYLTPTGSYYYVSTANQIAGGLFPVAQWTHVAISRTNGITKMFYGGQQMGISWTDASNYLCGTSIAIGANYAGNQPFAGYFDDFRITKGVSRYPSNFTPKEYAFFDYYDDTYDPYYSSNSLVIHGNGANNAVNTTFIDSSSYNASIIRSGDTTQGSFSPYPVTAGYPYSATTNIGSAYFDGTGDFLTISGSTNFDLSGGDFTVECWVYPTTFQTSSHVCAFMIDTANRWTLYFTSNVLTFWTATTAGGVGAARISASASPQLNTWSHIALVKSGSTYVLYVNGVSKGTCGVVVFPSGIQNLQVGTYNSGGVATDNFVGYITDFHVIKGYAKYTAAFPAPAAPVTPVTPVDQYTAQVVLSLPMDLAAGQVSGSTVFTERTGKVVTVNGNAVISTAQSKFNGSSAYFDGTGDYITVPKTTAFDFGANDFTFECWAYLTALGVNTRSLFSTASQAPDMYSVQIEVNAAGFLNAGLSTSGTTSTASMTSPGAFPLNQWNHIAVTRQGTSFKLFLNGVIVGSTTLSGAIYYASASPVCIATNPIWGGVAYDNKWIGYIDDLRVTIGAARYTADFSASVSSMVASDYGRTVALLKCANAAIHDETGKNNIAVYDNAKISTAQSMWGTGSLTFDGSGDYLTAINTGQFDPTGEFTAEGWFYNTSTDTTNIKALFGQRASAGYGWLVSVSAYPTTIIGIDAWSAANAVVLSIASTATMSINAWHHVAVTRSVTTWRVYLDGVQVAIGAESGTIATYAVCPAFTIGRNAGVTTRDWTGYMQDIRVTKGVARYTAINITIPARTFPDAGPTSVYQDPPTIMGPKNKFMESNKAVIDTDVTMDGSYNYLSAGPVTINTGCTVTVNPGTQWVVI